MTPLQRAEEFFERYSRTVMTPGTEFDRVRELKKVIEDAIKEDRATYRKQYRTKNQKADRTASKNPQTKQGKRKSKASK